MAWRRFISMAGHALWWILDGDHFDAIFGKKVSIWEA